MEKDDVIRLGTKLGLSFTEKSNYKDALDNGRVVFDGCNGQRILIESNWSDDEIYEEIGKSLILMGKRMKSLEIRRLTSINDDLGINL